MQNKKTKKIDARGGRPIVIDGQVRPLRIDVPVARARTHSDDLAQVVGAEPDAEESAVVELRQSEDSLDDVQHRFSRARFSVCASNREKRVSGLRSFSGPLNRAHGRRLGRSGSDLRESQPRSDRDFSESARATLRSTVGQTLDDSGAALVARGRPAGSSRTRTRSSDISVVRSPVSVALIARRSCFIGRDARRDSRSALRRSALRRSARSSELTTGLTREFGVPLADRRP